MMNGFATSYRGKGGFNLVEANGPGGGGGGLRAELVDLSKWLLHAVSRSLSGSDSPFMFTQ